MGFARLAGYRNGWNLSRDIQAAEEELLPAQEPPPPPPAPEPEPVARGNPPVCSSEGGPLASDYREINSTTGQQKDYVVLCPDERAKGFVRPYREQYFHPFCGAITKIYSTAIAETYARDPSFYTSTFCVRCQVHLPVGEFTWVTDNSRVGS